MLPALSMVTILSLPTDVFQLICLICSQIVWMREQCIKNVVRNTNIVSDTTQGAVLQCRSRDFHLFKTLIQDDETFNKAAARLHKTDENTLTRLIQHAHTTDDEDICCIFKMSSL